MTDAAHYANGGKLIDALRVFFGDGLATIGLERWIAATGTPPPGSEQGYSRLTALTTDASHWLRHADAGLLEALDTD
ncbi:hypothetical protein ACF1G5_32010 [Streptomyces coeruleorubidus]|uniref:hypothetical protein n=1 Tax=Streptomyces coeruleorubidus TaxID=116188 RepID=UPI003701C8F7